MSTVLFLSIHGGDYLFSEKDVFYDLRAVLVGTPIMIATWLEPLLCDRLLIDWGGHVYYDSAIPAGAVLYYLVASQLPPKKNKNKVR